MIITHRDNHAWLHANCEVQLLCAFVKTDAKRWSVSIRNAPSKLFESLWKFCERSLKFRWPTNDSPITRFVYGVDTIWMNIFGKKRHVHTKIMDKQRRANWWSFCTIIYWLIITEALFFLNFTINFDINNSQIYLLLY